MEVTAQTALDPAEMAHLMAVRTAEGSGIPQSWSTALDHLQRAADIGCELAKAELAGLAGDWVLANEIIAGKPWGKAHEQSRADVDIGAWINKPLTVAPSQEPRMAMVSNLIEPQICDWIIARSRPRLKRAGAYGRDGNVLIHENRTGSDCVFGVSERD